MNSFQFSSMKSCAPKCFKSKDKKPGDAAPQLATEEMKICFKCQTSQSVAKDATVFVCSNCHVVNRVNLVVQATVVDVATPGRTTPQILQEDLSELQTVLLKRVNSSTFLPLTDAPEIARERSSTPPGAASTSTSIPPCSICLDAPGDMIFLSCNHGGFCEACARHIASNSAVGGACCVKCRAAIQSLGRIVEVHPDHVKAVSVDLPANAKSKAGPPLVPPPRGFNKAKK